MRLLALTAMVCALSACGADAESATRLVLVADTDIERLDSVSFDVDPPGGEVGKRASGAVSPGQPAFVVMEKSDAASAGPYLVKVTGTDQGAEVVTRQASVRFVPGKTLAVPLHLVELCIGKECPETESCGPGGVCVARVVAENQLLEWTGVPPTLESVGPADAGSDASSPPVDAGDAGGAGDAGADDAGGGDGGNVLCDMDCADPGLCATSTCIEGMGCVTQAADDGVDCGSGSNTMLTCSDAVCGRGFACSANCSPSCDVGVAACEIDCGTAGNCNAKCPRDAPCSLRCRDADNCDVNCAQGASCTIDCDTSSDCRPNCATGSTCEVLCPDDQACDKATCRNDAQCVLHCVPGQACTFGTCTSDDQLTCPNGTVVCGRAC